LLDDEIDNAGGDEDDHDESVIVVDDNDFYDLALRKTLHSGLTPAPFVAGDLVTFRVRVWNQWTLPASGIQVTDYIPTGLTYVSSTAPLIANTANTVTFDYGTIAPWASAVFLMTFSIDAWFAGQIDNLAEITADDGNDVDSTTDTNPNNDVLVDNQINNANVQTEYGLI